MLYDMLMHLNFKRLRLLCVSVPLDRLRRSVILVNNSFERNFIAHS